MTTAILEKKLKPLGHPTENEFMRWLLTHLPPQPIVNKKLHRAYRDALHILMDAAEAGKIAGGIKADLAGYIRVVAGLLAEYERTAFPIKAASPGEVLAFLMEQHSLTQVDLAKDLGGQPVVSDVLNGKRQLTREHIERLSQRFKVSPAVFFPAIRQ